MAKIGLLMGKDGDGSRCSCFTFLNAKHNRTAGMESITLWTYDPTIQQVIDHHGRGGGEHNKSHSFLAYSFNLVGWVVDEHPANWKSMEVFGIKALESTFS